ncbi:MerC domain-containing protein [Chryseolinea lacunae]|uniref:MerC domain-containing protein n=1 Tax=Chryseolinea lacunae TaxID=2801331 RepID=A0ABS1KMZ0_9BACT|nr:MerC domain-containing protein [Chryseolinea lacunae]MBL0740612.1 MerC domain-containing protein [Chryseolinea lacunae]
MKPDHRHLIRFEKPLSSTLVLLADFSGLFASGLCFIHCWALPLLLIFLPGLITHNELVHPVLCSLSMVSTAPMLFKKTFRQQSIFFRSALALGNLMMLIILLAHDSLPFVAEIVLNTVGGLCLIVVHYNSLRRSKK